MVAYYVHVKVGGQIIDLDLPGPNVKAKLADLVQAAREELEPKPVVVKAVRLNYADGTVLADVTESVKSFVESL